MTEQGIGVLPGLWPIHGDGVLARQGDLVLLIHPAGGAFTDRLLDLLTDAARAGETGLRFASLIAAEFDADAAAESDADATAESDADAAAASGQPGPAATGQPGPAAVAFGPAGDGMAIAIYGTAWAEITTAHGTQQLTAGQPYGRLQCVLPSRVMKVRAGVQAADGDASTDPYLRLADGVVRAVALVYAPEETPRRTADRGRHALLPERTVMDAAWSGQAAAPSDQLDRAKEAAPVPAEPSVHQQQAGQAEQPAYQPDPGQAGQPAYQPEAGRAEQVVGDPFEADSLAGRSFISIPLIGDQAASELPQRDPLPLGAEPPDDRELGTADQHPQVVVGVYCKNGHFDDPEARYCAVCGIGMAQLTKMPQDGPAAAARRAGPAGRFGMPARRRLRTGTGADPGQLGGRRQRPAAPARHRLGPGVPDPRPRRARRLAGVHLRPEFGERHRDPPAGRHQRQDAGARHPDSSRGRGPDPTGRRLRTAI